MFESKQGGIELNSKTRASSSFLWIAGFLMHFKPLLAATLISTAVVAFGEILVPIFIRHFIDSILPRKNVSELYEFILILTSVYVVVLGAGVLRTYCQRELSENCCYEIQSKVLLQLRKLGMSYYESKSIGEIFSFFNTDIAQVQKIYRNHLPNLLHRSLFTIVSFGFMASIDLLLTIISILFFLTFFFLSTKFDTQSSRLSKELHGIKSYFDKRSYSHIAGQSELRAYGAQAWDKKRIVDLQKDYNKLDLKRMFYIWTRLVLRRLVISSGILIIFIYAGIQINNDNMTVGEASAYLVNYIAFMGSLTILITVITEQRLLKYNLDALQSLMMLSPMTDARESKEIMKSTELVDTLTLKNVAFSYDGKSVLKGINLSIQRGTHIAIVGKSGSGKSTLLKLLGRFYDPDSGKILLDGQPIQHIPLAKVREEVGFVFQDPYLFNDTIYNNIIFGNLQATQEEVIEAAKMADLHDYILQLPNGYNTIVGEEGVNLSGGQKQRICIARLFIKKPQIILLDEATSALDALSENAVHKALEVLAKDRTVIAISHRIAAMQLSDRIVLIQNGRVAESGTYAELLEKEGLLFKLINEKDASNER